ncbi:MAG: response regulator [Proteobacteria bacterium]|nr:response regulator [Desulfobacteraceae bacterium]MBU4001084.1 response regulator [Pseudomonadota bacterium]MBU4054687.1 response regulator [Pseudomonadota bacterium]MBU4318039.1 response regulator [Pseudomonadota bacterium]MBU4469463.1 response regulator [Pseudomonadota bacterium]
MNEKVLLIDDELEFIETLGERMKSRGMEVSSTVSPKEGLDIVENESFDAIILDLKMPEMDGMEVLKRLKNKNPDIQVILLTGNATVQKGIEAMKLGAMDLIEKPVDIAALTEKIKKAQARKMILVEKKTQEKIEKIINSKAW